MTMTGKIRYNAPTLDTYLGRYVFINWIYESVSDCHRFKIIYRRFKIIFVSGPKLFRLKHNILGLQKDGVFC